MQTMQGPDGMVGSQAEGSDLLEHSTDLVQIVASDGRFLYVKGGWLNALGYERREVAGLTVFDIIHPECSSQCAAMMKAVSAGKDIEEIETTLVSKTRQEIRVEGSIDCRFKDGVPAVTRRVFREVSERKAAEEALREGELRLRTIMVAVQDGIVLLDAETHVVVEANDTAI
jgi:adenylate cyclase